MGKAGVTFSIKRNLDLSITVGKIDKIVLFLYFFCCFFLQLTFGKFFFVNLLPLDWVKRLFAGFIEAINSMVLDIFRSNFTISLHSFPLQFKLSTIPLPSQDF